MKKIILRTLWLLAVLVLIGVLWYTSRPAPSLPTPAPAANTTRPTPTATPVLPVTQPEAPPAAAAAPALPQPVATPVLDLPADPLEANDVLVKMISELVGRKTVREFLQLDGLARRIVATVDSLPRGHSSWTIWPVNRTAGQFSVVPGNTENEGILSATNSARYTGFVQLVEALETEQWVTLYLQVYPLLQQAFAQLGYPDAAFHKRLLEVIDHLLAAPMLTSAPTLHLLEVRGPVASLQPWLRYEFKDPALQSMSAGQKMLMRMGAANHQKLRIKLTALRVALAVRAQALNTPRQP
jgi:hypothetical protein